MGWFDESLKRELSDLGDTISRKVRGSEYSGRGLAGAFGEVGKLVDYLLRGGSKPDTVTQADIEKVASAMAQGELGHTAGQYDIGGRPEATGQGTYAINRGGPKRGAPKRDIGRRELPVGTLPGNLFVPMTLVNSSNVYAVGYNGQTKTMRVQYKAAAINAAALRGRGHSGRNRVKGTGGKTVTSYRHGPGPLYDYHGVPFNVFNKILGAGSKGKAIWDNLRIRGTAYGHRYDYELVSASTALVVLLQQNAPPKRVGRVTYVPRKAAAPKTFLPRRIVQGGRTFQSLLPGERG